MLQKYSFTVPFAPVPGPIRLMKMESATKTSGAESGPSRPDDSARLTAAPKPAKAVRKPSRRREVVTKVATSISIATARYVRPTLFASLTGYTEDAVQTKIKRGVWLERKVYVYAPDNNILIDLKGYEEWVVSQ